MPRMQLTCGPVQLRLITPRSAHQLYQLAREPRVSEFMQWHPHRSIDDSLEFIHDAERLWRSRTAFLLGVFGNDERVLGATGIHHIDQANRVGEVGTWLGHAHQGKGLNRYCKAAIFTLAFDVLGLHRLEMLVRTDNRRSLSATAALPGVADEGIQHHRLWKDGKPFDTHMLAITADRYDVTAFPTVTLAGSLP